MKLTIETIDRHRNGSGPQEPFYVVTFHEYRKSEPMVAIVFKRAGHVAVLNRKLVGEGEVRFFFNSWRGDDFEPELRKAIEEWEKRRS